MKNSVKTIFYGLTMLAMISCAGSKPGSSGPTKTTRDYSNYTNMYDVLSAVGGITLKRSGVGVEVSVRGSQSITNTNEPLFVLNGVPIGRSFGSISHINPVRIERITVQRSLAATNRWGSEGNSGAILINLKGQN